MQHQDCSGTQPGTTVDNLDALCCDQRPKSTTERFLEFHHANPQVYAALRRHAVEWLATGKRRLGIELLWNRCRWELSLAIETDALFELNNDFKSFYSRALTHFEPQLAGMFEQRRAPEADAWIASLTEQAEVA